MRRSQAFTLVELLVVIGIVALLVGVLLPSLALVRQMAQNVACRSNLREIGVALRMYANDNHDRFPDAYTTGGSVYRMAPGRRNADDPSSLTEVFGMPAVLHGIDPKDDLSARLPRPVRYLPADSKVWVCPAMPEWMRGYGNTYFWNQSDTTMRMTSIGRSKFNNPDEASKTAPGVSAPPVILQDNVSFLPYPPGFRRTTGTQPVISPASNYVYPHPFRTRRTRPGPGARVQGAVNVLFITGQVGTNVYTYTAAGLTTETLP